jgi:phospholipase/lecithinase/hemolysin
MNEHKRIVVLVGVLITCFVLPVQADLYVFGDSLSDAGNVWDASTSDPTLQPDPIVPPFYMGRMSNGMNWADYVADDLGLGPLSASRIGGTNYAWAGATTGTGTTERRSLLHAGQTQPVDNIATQINSFTTDHGSFASDDLVLYWSGSNDILHYAIDDLPLPPPLPVPDAVAQLIALTWTNLHELEALGATRIVLPNQINAASSPVWSGAFGLPAGLQPYVSAVTQGFNAELPGLIASLESQVGFDAEIIYVDVYTLAEEVIADPAVYGFTNVTDPALYTIGANPDEYLFWDPIHPTTAGHRIIADAVMEQLVPEPAAILLLTTGLLAFWPLRRRKLH